MTDRNVARDVSNELLIWGTGNAINNFFKEKKIGNYKDWMYRKEKEIERKLTDEQKQRLQDFMNSESGVDFAYRAKSAIEFGKRYKEVTGRDMDEDGLMPTDLYYDAKFEKRGTDINESVSNSDFNMGLFIILIIVFFPAAIWYYIKYN